MADGGKKWEIKQKLRAEWDDTDNTIKTKKKLATENANKFSHWYSLLLVGAEDPFYCHSRAEVQMDFFVFEGIKMNFRD